MCKKLIFSLFVFLSIFAANAQDTLLLNNGKILINTITLIGPQYINLLHPVEYPLETKTIEKSEVFRIHFQNGRKSAISECYIIKDSTYALRVEGKNITKEFNSKAISSPKPWKTTGYILIGVGTGLSVLSGLTYLIAEGVYQTEMGRIQDNYLHGKPWPSSSYYTIYGNIANLNTAADVATTSLAVFYSGLASVGMGMGLYIKYEVDVFRTERLKKKYAINP